jgi:hypothetical protein
MSTLPAKADIAESDWHDPVCAKADILRYSEERRCSIALPVATASTGGTGSTSCSFVGGD